MIQFFLLPSPLKALPMTRPQLMRAVAAWSNWQPGLSLGLEPFTI